MSGSPEKRAPPGLFTTAMLVSLSIALHVFKIPYPLMTALKFDLVGIPLAVIAYRSLTHFAISLPLVWLGITAISQDWIGASMKILAEASTVIPFAALARGGINQRAVAASGALIAVLSRTAIMSIANYLVLPRWALLAGWASTLEEGYALASYTMPYIISFNVIMGAMVTIIGYYSINLMRRAGLMP